MNLAEMLSFADIQQLARIADSYNCVCNTNSKHELIQSILSTLGQKEIFERHVREMSLEEMRFLNSLLFEQRTSFSLEELVARVQQTRFEKHADDSQAVVSSPSGNPRDTIAKFKHSGWLFNGCSQQTKYLFQVPVDLKDRFREVLRHTFVSQLEAVTEPQAYRDEDGRIGEDVVHLLHFVHKENVLLNGEGVLYKRQQQQLFELFAIQECPVGKGEWRFGYGRRFHDYPNRFSLIYDYAFFQGWIEEWDGKLSLSISGEERMAKGGVEPAVNVYRFWLKMYKNAIPNLLSLVHWISLCTTSWTTVDSLEKTLLPFVKPFYFDSQSAVFRQRMLMMMVHLGLLRLGEHSEFGQVMQTTKGGQKIIQGVYVAHDDKIRIAIDNRKLH
ncbi:hypothetical protein [Paenibacillus sp. 481]|uniref:hypothetical protein n=1 Tax=Paenibacillus sp. 481 TaxID=2835869 RepID=UPI001E5C51AB|nr:hypothetical protein [Paenibacillus sp. 481]UHA72978.1 hypothetical protein KIK04_20595 [Paenibacillus sp. 481]